MQTKFSILLNFRAENTKRSFLIRKILQLFSVPSITYTANKILNYFPTFFVSQLFELKLFRCKDMLHFKFIQHHFVTSRLFFITNFFKSITRINFEKKI